MPKKHEDARGFFQELYHWSPDDPEFVQVSWFSIEPHAIRGEHYHKKTHEMFIVLEGTVRFMSGDKPQVLNEGDVVRSQLGVIHSFEAGANPAKILAFSTRHFNPNDTDTYQ